MPVTVNEVLTWSELCPSRWDLMATHGVVLENAADMAVCFPELWNTTVAARQDRARSVTYQPKGAEKKPRSAVFDLDLISDPQSWLNARIGQLASFEAHPNAASDRAALDALSLRLAAHKPTEITNPNPQNGE